MGFRKKSEDPFEYDDEKTSWDEEILGFGFLERNAMDEENELKDEYNLRYAEEETDIWRIADPEDELDGDASLYDGSEDY